MTDPPEELCQSCGGTKDEPKKVWAWRKTIVKGYPESMPFWVTCTNPFHTDQ